MARKEISEVRNIWLSDKCAATKCGACPEKKEFGNSMHICNCRCHTRSRYGAKVVTGEKRAELSITS